IQDTLFIVASKSGETTETLSHFAYFWNELNKNGRSGAAGRHFAAITDPGTSLQKLAEEHSFRWIFKNPPDIGGRYSALSYFGMVPGALAGVDVVEMLERGVEMAHSCAPTQPPEKNPGVWLGAEFLRWEVATAVAGSILGIDAFDQPNVQESKDNTKRVLDGFKKSGKLPAAEAVPAAGAARALKQLLGKAKKGAYVATMAYV